MRTWMWRRHTARGHRPLYVSPTWRRALLPLLHGAAPESCKTGQPVPFFEKDYRVGAALDEQAQLRSSLFETVIGSLGAVVETGETGEIAFPSSSSSSLDGPATIVVKFAATTATTTTTTTTTTPSGSYEHRPSGPHAHRARSGDPANGVGKEDCSEKSTLCVLVFFFH